MKRDLYDSLTSLAYNPAYLYIQEQLRKKFDVNMNKLRDGKSRKDETFLRTQGLLDGLEYAIKILQSEINNTDTEELE